MRFLKLHLLTLFLILAACPTLHAQTDEPVFKAGERLTYKAFYNWGVIWVYAADVEFEISQKMFGSKSALCFEAKANSIPRYDWFFKVRDNFRSFATPDDLHPLWAERNTSEGSQKIYELYQFQNSTKKIHSTIKNSNKPSKKDTINSMADVYDVLTAVYNARNLDFSRYKTNDKIPVKIVLDGKIHPLFIRYLGKEVIKDRSERSYKCFRFSSFMVAGTAFKGGEDVSVWVTDDQNRVPILVEAKVLIGSVKAYLDSYNGLKFPMKALLN